MTTMQKVKKVAEILKERFPNLGVLEVIDLATKIVDAIDE